MECYIATLQADAAIFQEADSLDLSAQLPASQGESTQRVIGTLDVNQGEVLICFLLY